MTPTSAPARAPQSPAPQTKIAPPSRTATDDEILGITTFARKPLDPRQLALNFEAESPVGAQPASAGRHAAPGAASRDASHDRASGAPAPSEAIEDPDASASPTTENAPEHLREIIDANPELRRAWDDANVCRETIGTPEEAREAKVLLADLNYLDALFFSRHPADHAELARQVANLDPQAFKSLANAMAAQAANGFVAAPFTGASLSAARHASSQDHDSGDPASSPVGAQHAAPVAAPSGMSHDPRGSDQPGSSQSSAAQQQPSRATTPTAAQTEFFHSTNAATVEGVIDAIESQVERLLPDGISKSARSRVVGEIYRELDTTLRANRQLSQQMRDAFRSGSLDADHQRAIVSLVTGRARQALPAVAKRVMNEWTSTLVAANQDRRARQRSAERRVDIAGSSGSGNDGHRSMTPRDLDYKRLSDADILNM
jgi:hypothetical protein